MPPVIGRVLNNKFQTENVETDGFVIFDSKVPSKQLAKSTAIPVLYVPEGFHPEQHLSSANQKLADRARYILHTMHTRMIFDQKKRKDGQGVRLKAEYLRNFVGRKKLVNVRQDLEDHGVIEVVKKSCTGKSFEYRFAANFRTQKVRRYTPTDTRLIKKLREYRSGEDKKLTCPTRRHLRKQLMRVKIDFDAARNELENLDLTAEGHASCLNCLIRLHEQDWYFVADKYGRVHHNISCLKRELRQYLRVDGESLVELDIANSQPLFCGLSYCHWFSNNLSLSSLHDKDSFSGALSLNQDNIESFITPLSLNIPQLQQEQEREDKLDIPLRCHFREIVNNDGLKYLMLCEQGQIYEYLAEASGEDISTDKKRNRFKEKVFSHVLFAKRNHMTNSLAKVFKTEFPSIHEMIVKAKQKDNAGMAKWMQRVESSFVIDRVVKRFIEERTDAFILTIHDSVLSKQEDADYIRNLFRQEFGSFGVHPTLKQK